MLDHQDTDALMRRLLQPGRMKRIPKGQKDAEAFLALAASTLDPRRDYTEQALNEELAEWLGGFTRSSALDHVTVRRYLVDLNFLIRDASGSSYRANQTIINTVITPDARSVQPALIYEALRAQREAKRKTFSRVEPRLADRD